MTNIAFLGLGAMGSRMANRLLAAGHSVTVWNRDPARASAIAGAETAESPAAAAKGAEMVLSMVRDDPASEAVWLGPSGAFAGMRPGAVAIECSTISLGWARTFAAEADARGLPALDAPVAGSLPQAEAGQLIFIVGGPAETLALCAPVLGAMGGAVHHAGAAGAGVAVKLAINALLGIQATAVAELLGLISRSGVDPARAIEILGTTAVISPYAKAAAAGMLADAFAPLFALALAEKDLAYAEAATSSALPVTAAARSVLNQALESGFGAENVTAVARLYRE